MSDKITKEEIIQQLFTENDTRITVLCDDSAEVRKLSDEISTTLRSDPRFSLRMDKKFRATNRMIQHGDTRIYFGVVADAQFLTNAPDEIVRMYAKG